MATRILVVDDEPGIRRALENCLKICGFEVEIARDAAQGLSMLEKRIFDGLTLGLIMPHMNGVQFLRQLRQKHPSLPVAIISSGYDQLTDSDTEFVKENAQTLLWKPFNVAELVPILSKCFGPVS